MPVASGRTDEMIILASTDRAFAKTLRKIATRSQSQGASVEKSVRVILAQHAFDKIFHFDGL
jgi:hypothetical protein